MHKIFFHRRPGGNCIVKSKAVFTTAFVFLKKLKNRAKKVLHFSFVCANIFEHKKYALLAQLDRVTGYEPVGQGFESLAARQNKSTPIGVLLFWWAKGTNRDPRFNTRKRDGRVFI